MIEKGITLAGEQVNAESLALAQLKKRIGFHEWRQNSIDDEAYLIQKGDPPALPGWQ
jgi:hypothetical protein